MKFTPLARATLFACALATALLPLKAQPVTNSGYTATSYYTDTDSNSIVSFDWDSSNNLYFQTGVTSDFSYNLGGFYKVHSGTTSTLLPGSTSNYVGASVVSIGNYVYFNDGLGTIYNYDTVGASGLTAISTTTNFGLYKGPDSSLYITGFSSGSNHIFHSALNGSGTLVSDPATDLGGQTGYSGPLAFDASGNLYYAPGYNDLSIYKWTSAQVAAALLSPGTSPLTSANAQKWLDYSSLYGSAGGGTSLLINGDQLLLTLTSFSSASDLASFDINSTTGDYVANSAYTILQDSSSPLGELRMNGGNLFLSDGTQIYEIQAVPEPSTLLLLALGAIVLVYFRHRRNRRLIPATVAVASVFFSITGAWAGPYSPAADQPGSTGIAAGSSSFQEWANSVVNLTRGPVNIANPTGATATFGTASNALGVADSSQANPNNVVSLGDGGSITLSFATPITNGSGADFAVFENGFPESGVPGAYFLELATVSVSSDGVHFFTFPSVSLTQTTTQIASFGTLDPTNLYNLAGSEIVGYGTPFNLSDLSSIRDPNLNINAITEVRVTDVVGSINPSYGTLDSLGNLINDPYPTAFPAGGFDLDAIGVLNILTVPEPSPTWLLLAGLGSILVIRRYLQRQTRA